MHPEIIIQLCSERLNITLDSKEIQRAHRLGRHNPGHKCPIVVQFSAFKTKEAILTNARKLKGTTYSIGEDFSRRVQNARKTSTHLQKASLCPTQSGTKHCTSAYVSSLMNLHKV